MRLSKPSPLPYSPILPTIRPIFESQTTGRRKYAFFVAIHVGYSPIQDTGSTAHFPKREYPSIKMEIYGIQKATLCAPHLSFGYSS